MPPGAIRKYGKTDPKQYTLKEPKLFMLTVKKNVGTVNLEEVVLPVEITGFRCELSGNLMLYNNRRIWVLHEWVDLKQATFADEIAVGQKPEEAIEVPSGWTEPA